MPVTQHSLASFPTKVERHTQVPGEINSALQPATKPRISRRTILIGGGTALVLLGGSAGTWAIMNTMRKQASTSKARTIPSPTPDPDGPDLILRGHTKPVTSLAWSLQTTTMLASVADDGTALLWQIKQSQQLAVRLSPIEKQSFQPSGPLQIAWSSDGKFLAIGNTGKGQPGTSSSIDMYTGDLQKTAPGYTTALLISDIPAIAGLEWQNQYLIALATQPSSAGKKQLQLNLWDPQQPQQQLLPVSIAGSLPTNRSNRSPLLQISPDASSLALEEAEGVVIGQIKPSGTTVQWQQQLGPAQPDGQIKAISWVSGGAALTALTTKNNKDFTLTYWNTQKEIEQDPITTNAIITTVAWNPAPTSNLIATGSLDGRVLIWKVGGNNIPAILSSNLNAAVIILSWSADGQWLAAGFNDKDASILVWNIQGRGI